MRVICLKYDKDAYELVEFIDVLDKLGLTNEYAIFISKRHKFVGPMNWVRFLDKETE